MPAFEWNTFVKDANAQHKGGQSFDKGSRFQIFVEAVEFLRVAANIAKNRIGPNPEFRVEVRGSRVDDLHVIWTGPETAWRFQIKAVDDLRFTLKLETQFRQEAYFYPRSQFFLIVHDSDLADELTADIEGTHLEFVKVDHLEIELQEAPFNNQEIQDLLDSLLLNAETQVHHLATWTAMSGTWGRLRGGRFSELWEDMCEASKYTLRPIAETPLMAIARAEELDKLTDSLSVAAVGEIMLLRGDELFSAFSLPRRMSLTDGDFWNPMPSNAWELFDKLGAL